MLDRGHLLALALGLIILITFFGNVLVCLSVIKVRKLRHPSNYLLISLAISDLCVACFVMPFGLYSSINDKWQLGTLLCNVYVVSDVTSCTASILNLCVISIDRYFAITRPLTYCMKRTTKLMLLLIGLVWALACLISVPPLLISGNEYGTPEEPKCEVSQSVWYQLYATIFSFYIPLAVMIFIYYNIYTAAKKVVEAEQRATTGLQVSQEQRRRRHHHHLQQQQQQRQLGANLGNLSQMSKADRRKQQQQQQQHHFERAPGTKSASLTGVLANLALATSQKRRANSSTSASLQLESPVVNELPAGATSGPTPEVAPSCSLMSGPREAQLLAPQQHQQHQQQPHHRLQLQHHQHQNQLQHQNQNQQHQNQQQQQPQNLQQHQPNQHLHHHSSLQHRSSSIGSSQHNSSSQQQHRQHKGSVMRERKASITLGIIMSAFTICWLPFFIIALVRPFSDTVNNLPRAFVLLTLWLGYANSLLNPIIYVTFHHDFRNAFKHLLCFRCMTINERIRKDEYKSQYGDNTNEASDASKTRRAHLANQLEAAGGGGGQTKPTNSNSNSNNNNNNTSSSLRLPIQMDKAPA